MGGAPERITRQGGTSSNAGGHGQSPGLTGTNAGLKKRLRESNSYDEGQSLVTEGLGSAPRGDDDEQKAARIGATLQSVTHEYGSLKGARIAAVQRVAVLAEAEKKTSMGLDILTNLVSSVATAMTGGVSAFVTKHIKDLAVRAAVGRALGATAAAANKIAETAVGDALRGAQTPEQKRKLFFLALEGEVASEIDEAVRAFLEDTYLTGEVPAEGPKELARAFLTAKPAILALQEREARRAWLVFQAQQELGTSPRAGTPVEEGAQRGGTRLGVDGSGGVAGVLQVEIDTDDPSRIVAAELDGLGAIPASDMKQTPLGELDIPIRFAGEGAMGETRFGIFVNEAGMAVAQGRAMEHFLYRLGGGPERLGPKDEVHPNERHFVDEGLARLTAKLLAQRLGDKLEL